MAENDPPAGLEKEERAPALGLKLMGAVLAGFALLAIYSNIQSARRHQLESATLIPVSPTPAPRPSASPPESAP